MPDFSGFQASQPVGSINPNAYLHRIGVSPESPDLKLLKRLHRAHLLHIPFENLDIHYHRKIILDVDRIFQKIVVNNRGGLGFELNLLFYHLLIALGYQCMLISCHVRHKDRWGSEYDHMAVLVKIEETLWLADVGFGKLFSEPKILALNQPQLDYNNYYRFEIDPDEKWILKRSKDNHAYLSIYRFELKPRTMIEFIPMCDWHQESDKSLFTQNKLITQLFSNGRITLTDRKLTLDLNGETTEIPIMNEDEFLTKLEQHFGIDAKKLITQRLND